MQHICWIHISRSGEQRWMQMKRCLFTGQLQREFSCELTSLHDYFLLFALFLLNYIAIKVNIWLPLNLIDGCVRISISLQTSVLLGSI